MAADGKAARMEECGNAESLQGYCKGAPAMEPARLLTRDGVEWPCFR